MKGLLKFIYFAFKSFPLVRQNELIKKDTQVVSVLVDILYNIAHENIVPTDKSIINKLSKYRKQIYKVIAKTTSHKTRAKIFIKYRQIIHIILPLIPSISASLDNEPLYQDVSN
jgi:hypothetical protein